MLRRGCGSHQEERQFFQGVTKLIVNGSVLERRALAGNSPVHENEQPPDGFPE